MSEEQQAEFLEHMRNGMRRGAAAYAMGLTRVQACDFIEATPAFEKLVLDAEAEANEHVEEAIWQSAVSGSVSAARLWLQMRRKPEAGPLMDTSDDPGDMDAELAALLKMTTE